MILLSAPLIRMRVPDERGLTLSYACSFVNELRM